MFKQMLLKAAPPTSKGELTVIPPKKLVNPTGQGDSPSFNPASPKTVLSAPTYRDHLTDIFETRQASDARDLVQGLMKTDPDMSAATNAYLTVANRPPLFLAKTADNQIDLPAQQVLNQILLSITSTYDYTLGYSDKKSWRQKAEDDRYMLLMRGALAGELIITKDGIVDDLTQIDPKSLEWFEPANNTPYPQQVKKDGVKLPLNFPTIFVTSYRQDPTSYYPSSPFISAINTIAARQQVINDLYRIMKIHGYPRMDITVLEDVLLKNAPMTVRGDADAQNLYVTQQINAISAAVSNLRPDQAFVHTDSIETGMMNESKPSMSIDITPVITVLNAQNQAGLRAMSTVLGRGESGVNTASTEARLFAMMADELNFTIADHWGKALTLALRVATNTNTRVEVTFESAEMRSDLELEPQKIQRAQRLKQDLSLGIISDAEYTLQMYRRLPLPGAPLLSGTKFMDPALAVADPATKGPSDQPKPLDKAAATPGSKAAKSNAIK